MMEVLEGQEVSASSGHITLPNHASRCRPTHHAAGLLHATGGVMAKHVALGQQA